MGIHIEPTAGAKRRVMWQRLVCGMGGVVIAGGMVGGAGSVLDRILTDPVPEYQPQFVAYPTEPWIGCGGLPPKPVRVQIQGRPIPPDSFEARPLGLARPKAPEIAVIPFDDVPDWESDPATWD
jgi:hypothetical protein